MDEVLKARELRVREEERKRIAQEVGKKVYSYFLNQLDYSEQEAERIAFEISMEIEK